MKPPEIVIDTNVFIASLRSQYGASYKLFMLLGSGKYEANLSVPLALEYEEVAKRLIGEIPLTVRDIDDILDYICSAAGKRKIFYPCRLSDTASAGNGRYVHSALSASLYPVHFSLHPIREHKNISRSAPNSFYSCTDSADYALLPTALYGSFFMPSFTDKINLIDAGNTIS